MTPGYDKRLCAALKETIKISHEDAMHVIGLVCNELEQTYRDGFKSGYQERVTEESTRSDKIDYRNVTDKHGEEG